MRDYDRNAPLTGEEIRAMRAYLDEHPVEAWPPEGFEFFDILRIAATLEYFENALANLEACCGDLRSQRDALKEELRRYGQHRQFCPRSEGGAGCNCGLAELEISLR